MNDIATFGIMAAISAACILAGASLGYYTASTDLRRVRAQAWDEGAQAWTQGFAINPYRHPALAPEPPHYIVPTPDAPRRGELFDQDEAGSAIELRGDDS